MVISWWRSRRYHCDMIMISWAYHSDVLCDIMRVHHGDVLEISWCYNLYVTMISWWCTLVYHGLWYSWYHDHIIVMCCVISWECIMVMSWRYHGVIICMSPWYHGDAPLCITVCDTRDACVILVSRAWYHSDVMVISNLHFYHYDITVMLAFLCCGRMIITYLFLLVYIVRNLCRTRTTSETSTTWRSLLPYPVLFSLQRLENLVHYPVRWDIMIRWYRLVYLYRFGYKFDRTLGFPGNMYTTMLYHT